MFIPLLKSLPHEDVCIQVKAENHGPCYLCDCGDASLLEIKDCQDAAAVFVSHTHLDHFLNFDTILRHQLGIQKTVVVTGPPGIAEQLHHKIKGYIWNLIEKDSIAYEVRELSEEKRIRYYRLEPPLWELQLLKEEVSEVVYENELFQVLYTLLDHKIPTVSYLFKERDTLSIDMSKTEQVGGKWVRELKLAFEENRPKAEIDFGGKTVLAETLFPLLYVKKGDSLGIIMDHAATEENHARILKLFSGANKVFIETFYKKEDKEKAERNFHSYSVQSAKVMKAAGVKHPIPIHFSRKYTQEEIDCVISEFRAVLDA